MRKRERDEAFELYHAPQLLKKWLILRDVELNLDPREAIHLCKAMSLLSAFLGLKNSPTQKSMETMVCTKGFLTALPETLWVSTCKPAEKQAFMDIVRYDCGQTPEITRTKALGALINAIGYLQRNDVDLDPDLPPRKPEILPDRVNLSLAKLILEQALETRIPRFEGSAKPACFLN